jgi:hypothetical protein
VASSGVGLCRPPREVQAQLAVGFEGLAKVGVCGAIWPFTPRGRKKGSALRVATPFGLASEAALQGFYPKISSNCPGPAISPIDCGSLGASSWGNRSKLHHPTSCHLPSLNPTRRYTPMGRNPIFS